MKRRVRAFFLVSAVLVLAAGTGAACRKGEDPGLIVASGHVEATEVLVSTKVAGTIESLAVDEGTTVAAGQELARIDTTDTRLALDAGDHTTAAAALSELLRRAPLHVAARAHLLALERGGK